MTQAVTSPGKPTSSRPLSATHSSVNLPPVPQRPAPTASGDPRGEKASSLYALGIQAQDIAGEIALAAELLESDDPEEQQTAINLIESYLAAADHTAALLADKADNVARYVDHLRAVSEFRKQQAQRLAELAAADARRAEKLTNYMLKVLTTLQPEATKFSLPTHELRSRQSTSVEITDEGLIPEELMRIKVEKAPDKSAIKQALKQGQDIPGAQLITKRNWSIN